MKASKSYSSRYQREKIQEYLQKGALVVDVRSKREWEAGHVSGSRHIEFSKIPGQLKELKNLNLPIITVCVSGMRSGQAMNYLKENGLDSINGGSRQNVANLVS
ncbi:rhodanese-like domain-containing protein [Flagellimonas sp.]|uniref:rhodanese-like domain-containing protein n=1 Tax=Flagellimonas sp. TaxID=2058762 RepID=UPI003B590BA0